MGLAGIAGHSGTYQELRDIWDTPGHVGDCGTWWDIPGIAGLGGTYWDLRDLEGHTGTWWDIPGIAGLGHTRN